MKIFEKLANSILAFLNKLYLGKFICYLCALSSLSRYSEDKGGSQVIEGPTDSKDIEFNVYYKQNPDQLACDKPSEKAGLIKYYLSKKQSYRIKFRCKETTIHISKHLIFNSVINCIIVSLVYLLVLSVVLGGLSWLYCNWLQVLIQA